MLSTPLLGKLITRATIIRAKPTHKKCCNCLGTFPNIAPHFHGKSRLCGPCRNRDGREKYNFISDKKRQLKYRYGLEWSEYQLMLEEQEGKCFLCYKHGRLVVDHNHTTGQVRKLLCHSCNRLVAYIELTPELVDKAKIYVN